MLLQDLLSPDLITRATDQLFSLGLLVAVSWVLWKRLSTIEDRMDQYLREDHERMTKALEDNNEALRSLREAIKENSRV